MGRRGDGRARGARAVGRGELLRRARAGRPLDGRRLVPHRRHRLDPSARLHPDQGPLEGRDQVGRRVDLVGRARERADGASGGRRGGGDRDPRRQVGRAAARGGRAAATGASATADELREFLAPSFAKWWLPERFEFVDEIPKTSVGKFRKTALREQFAARDRRRRLESRACCARSTGRSSSRDVPDPVPRTARCSCACARPGSTSPTS